MDDAASRSAGFSDCRGDDTATEPTNRHEIGRAAAAFQYVVTTVNSVVDTM